MGEVSGGIGVSAYRSVGLAAATTRLLSRTRPAGLSLQTRSHLFYNLAENEPRRATNSFLGACVSESQ